MLKRITRQDKLIKVLTTKYKKAQHYVRNTRINGINYGAEQQQCLERRENFKQLER